MPFQVKWSPFFLIILLSIALGNLTLPAQAQPREKCVQERAEADRQYLDGRFEEAIQLLQRCLDRETLFSNEAVDVYRLLALAYMNGDDLVQAQHAVRSLLEVVPDYEPDPIQDPPSYRAMVTVVQQEMQAQAAMLDQEEEPSEEERPAERQGEEVVANDQPAVRRPQFQPEIVADAQQPRRRRRIRTPKNWLLATGGAIVVATAVAITVGGGSTSTPAGPSQ